MKKYFLFLFCLIVGHRVERTVYNSRKRTAWLWKCLRCSYSYHSGRKGGFDRPTEKDYFTKRLFPSSGFYGTKEFSGGGAKVSK